MNRRAFLIGGLLSSTAMTRAWAWGTITVIYVGGLDCPPCQHWKNKYKAQWLASPEFQKVRWIEIESPKLTEAYQPRYWGGELQAILEKIPYKAGTPRFLVVQNDRIIDNQLGNWAPIVADVKKLTAWSS